MGGAKAHYDGIVAFSQTDFTEDLKKITVPVLVMHGDDDQIVPYADSGPLSAKLVQNGTLKTYHGFPHGMPTTEADDHQRRPARIHQGLTGRYVTEPGELRRLNGRMWSTAPVTGEQDDDVAPVTARLPGAMRPSRPLRRPGGPTRLATR